MKTTEQPTSTATTVATHRFPWARVMILAVVALLGAMWVYALFYAPTGSPEKVRDAGWARRAEALCVKGKVAIDALPAARTFKDVKPVSEALRQRADVAERATNVLVDRVAALRALPLTNAAAVKLAGPWLVDYDNYIGDRRAQVASWRKGQNPMFAETATDNGAPGSLRMDEFARVNAMPSCKVPQDIG